MCRYSPQHTDACSRCNQPVPAAIAELQHTDNQAEETVKNFNSPNVAAAVGAAVLLSVAVRHRNTVACAIKCATSAVTSAVGSIKDVADAVASAAQLRDQFLTCAASTDRARSGRAT